MVLGPHALGLMSNDLMNARWYTAIESILECTVGLMIGTELLWSQMKRAGKQIIITTVTESFGNIFRCQRSIWSNFLFRRFTSLSCLHVWCNRAGYSPCSFIIDCQ